jgi:hypothetical protein
MIPAALIAAITMGAAAPALQGHHTLPVSVVRPCQQDLAEAARMGEHSWIGRCANRKTREGTSGPAAIRACREWIAACQRNPRHPLPPGVNNL